MQTVRRFSDINSPCMFIIHVQNFWIPKLLLVLNQTRICMIQCFTDPHVMCALYTSWKGHLLQTHTKRKETPIWDGNVWMKELSEWIRLILFHLVGFENVIVWKSLYVRLQSLFWIIQGSMWNHFIVMTSYSPPLCLCLQIYMHDHSVHRIPWWKMYLFNEKKHAYKQTLISKVLTTLIHLVSYLS